MTKEEILELVKKYTQKAGIKIIDNTLSYSGIREKTPQMDGNFKAMHVVTFSQEAIKDNPNTIYVSFVTVDVVTNKLVSLTNKFVHELIDFDESHDD